MYLPAAALSVTRGPTAFALEVPTAVQGVVLHVSAGTNSDRNTTATITFSGNEIIGGMD